MIGSPIVPRPEAIAQCSRTKTAVEALSAYLASFAFPSWYIIDSKPVSSWRGSLAAALTIVSVGAMLWATVTGRVIVRRRAAGGELMVWRRIETGAELLAM